MMRFPFARPELGEPEWQAVREVIESGWVTQGPRVAAFERALAEGCGAGHAVAVSSCTAALHLSLVCAGVRPGDEVIVPSMSFIATSNVVVHAGATPVFAEVDPETFNLDPDDVRQRITSRTRAVIVVHQLGLPAQIDDLVTVADDAGLELIEDAACALGSRYRGAPIGSHTDLVCFSFHPRKVLTMGDGGAVLTSSAEHAERLRRLRQHGMSIPDLERHRSDSVIRESYLEVGWNYRLTDIQAAIGVAQLQRLDGLVERRRTLAAVYDEALEGHRVIQVPEVPPGVEWNVQTYAVRLRGFDASRRDTVMQHLLDRGIATRPGVMTAHREPAYAWLDSPALPVSEVASDGSLALPLHAGMDAAGCREVAREVREVVDEVAPR